MASLWTLYLSVIFTSVVINAQFLYNYEQEQPTELVDSEEYDPGAYKYNTPSAVERHFLQTSRVEQPVARNYDAQTDPAPEQYQSRQQQPSPRRYKPQPQPIFEDYAPEADNAPNPPVDYSPVPSPRRQQRRRRPSRVRQSYREEIVEPPKYYGPSIFENIGLGQAPSGVYVPEDSLLNILRNDKPRRSQPTRAQYASEVDPADENFQQPDQTRSYRPNNSPFFVQPPQQSHAPPVARNQAPQQQPLYVPSPPQREQYVQPTQPRYQPSSQEIQQNIYRQQRRQVQAMQQPGARPYRNQQRERPVSYVAPQPQVEYREPAQPIYYSDVNDEYPDDIRRSPARRPQETPRRRPRPQVLAATAAPEVRRRTTHKPANLAIAALPDDTDDDGIPGEAGVDYPTLHVIPSTSFSCSQQPHNGYYADLETSCQVMHLCQSGGVQSSFLCPNGTIFSQEKFSCQWWYEVNCQNAPRYYSINDRLYKVPNETEKK